MSHPTKEGVAGGMPKTSSRSASRPTTTQAWRWRVSITQSRPGSRWNASTSLSPASGCHANTNSKVEPLELVGGVDQHALEPCVVERVSKESLLVVVAHGDGDVCVAERACLPCVLALHGGRSREEACEQRDKQGGGRGIRSEHGRAWELDVGPSVLGGAVERGVLERRAARAGRRLQGELAHAGEHGRLEGVAGVERARDGDGAGIEAPCDGHLVRGCRGVIANDDLDRPQERVFG